MKASETLSQKIIHNFLKQHVLAVLSEYTRTTFIDRVREKSDATLDNRYISTISLLAMDAYGAIQETILGGGTYQMRSCGFMARFLGHVLILKMFLELGAESFEMTFDEADKRLRDAVDDLSNSATVFLDLPEIEVRAKELVSTQSQAGLTLLANYAYAWILKEAP